MAKELTPKTCRLERNPSPAWRRDLCRYRVQYSAGDATATRLCITRREAEAVICRLRQEGYTDITQKK